MTSRWLLRLQFAVCIAAATGFAARLVADEKPLKELISADAGVVIEFNKLAERVPAAWDSKLAERIRKTPVYEKWLESEDFRQLMQTKEAIEAAAQRATSNILKTAFGEQVILAAYAIPDKEPAGILLTKTPGSDELKELLGFWNGENVTVESLNFENQPYVRRTEEKKRPSGQTKTEVHYYTTLGATLAVSDDEQQIQKVLILSRDFEEESVLRLADDRRYLGAIQPLKKDSIATVYFNPRAWDQTVIKGKEQHIVRHLWKQLDALAIGIHAGDEIKVDAVISLTNTPELWKQAAARANGPLGLMARVPGNAIFAVAGRYDPASFAHGVLADEKRKRDLDGFRNISRAILMGQDLFDDMLVNFGANYGGWVVPRKEFDSLPALFDGLFVIEIPNATTNDNAPRIQAGLDNAINMGMNGIAVYLNAELAKKSSDADKPPKSLFVQVKQSESGTVRWIDTPYGFSPACLVGSGYLAVASSPSLVEQLVDEDQTSAFLENAAVKPLAEQLSKDQTQAVVANISGLRAFLYEHRETLIDQTAEQQNRSRESVKQRMSRLYRMLELIDVAYVSTKVSESGVHMTLGLRAN